MSRLFIGPNGVNWPLMLTGAYLPTLPLISTSAVFGLAVEGTDLAVGALLNGGGEVGRQAEVGEVG